MIYHILFAILTYVGFIVVVDAFKVTYSPFHCKIVADETALVENSVTCEFGPVGFLGAAFREVGFLMLFIFSLGPIRVFFKIKEGKTSVEKLVEGYEDERGIMRPGTRKGGILPSDRPVKRVHVARDAN